LALLQQKYKTTINKKGRKNMQKDSGNSYIKACRVLKTTAYFVPIILCSVDVYAAFDLDAGIKAATDPVKKMINDYYPVGIFITGSMGALLQQQGDLRDRMLGFGKGALIGGLTVLGVKTGLGL
jgi:hypothetical protein